MAFAATFCTLLVGLLAVLLGYRLSTVPRVTHAVSFSFGGDGVLPQLKENRRLTDGAQALFEGELTAPEHFAFSRDGAVYTSLADGRIVRFAQAADGAVGPLETVLSTPARPAGQPPCGSHEAEEACGRPLGMAFDASGALIVADCYHGLLRVNVATGQKTVLLSSVAGREIFFANSVAIGPVSGKIYFTDSSSRWRRKDFIYEVLESAPTGRLISFDPRTLETRVLVDEVAFANGILVDAKEENVFFVELNRAQILRLDLTAPPAAEPIHWDRRRDEDDQSLSVLIDNLPGIPDNLAWEEGSSDTFWIGCGTARKAPFSFPDAISRMPLLRDALTWLLPKTAFLKLVPQVGLLLRVRVSSTRSVLNPHGWVLGSLLETMQDPTGRYRILTGAYEHQGYLYIGSISDEMHFVPRIRWTTQNATDATWRIRD